MDTRQTPERLLVGRLALALLLAMTPAALAACSSSVGGNSDGADDGAGDGGADDGAEPLPEPESIDAVDVLLVVDGSGSMADKQGFLAESFVPFLDRLRNPRCVDAAGEVVGDQPATTAEPCPAGSVRQYTPDVTVHVGVVSSSLGAAGSEICSGHDGRLDDDGARLVHRGPGSTSNDLATYQNLGFFAWDPAARLSPAGESDFEHFAAGVLDAIRGVGEIGCGFEQPLEAMYRFLADPAPRPVFDHPEIDTVILAQRAAFLRPTSVLSVILLADENDASLRPDAIGRYSAEMAGVPMPRPRAECATDPAGACCVSCIEAIPAGCSGDGGCAEPGAVANPANYLDQGDPDNGITLRHWESKRRFGIDFLTPIDRYVEALSSPTLTLGEAETAPNPVFAGGRQPRHVVYTAIVGVPWQDVAVDPADITKGFQSAAAMRERGTWDLILGDPEAYVPATDPRMIESPLPRPGIDLATEGGDPINGGERETFYEDLQYACVFALPAEDQRLCDATSSACDCGPSEVVNPLCDPEQPNLQIRAKAFPGLRQLAVAEALQDQGRVVPMCSLLLAEQASDPGAVGTIGLEVGLGSVAEDVASRMHP